MMCFEMEVLQPLVMLFRGQRSVLFIFFNHPEVKVFKMPPSSPSHLFYHEIDVFFFLFQIIQCFHVEHQL